MPRAFDVVLASNDMSLDRVLGTGLPVTMVFYSRDLPSHIRQEMDKLAKQYAGKALMISLAQADAPQAISRFGVRQFPTLVTVKDGKTITHQENVTAGDLKLHLAYLLGEGPKPDVQATSRPNMEKQYAGSKAPIHVGDANFEREVLRSDLPVLVDFWAPWCGPCRMVEPVLNKLAQEQAGTLKIAKVNVDENPNLASRYGAMSIPTMLVMVGGHEADRWVGALPESAIRSRIARWIRQKQQTT